MKHFLLTALVVSGLTFMAASSASAQQDTVKRKKNFDINYGIGVRFNGKKDSTDVNKGDSNIGHFGGGITFTRLDIGFLKLIDNGSFSLSPTNKALLDYRGAKTSTVSFDVLQFGYRFNSNFRIYLAGGFDWSLIRLRNNLTMQPDKDVLTAIQVNDNSNNPIVYSKNRFSSSYVHIPLNFELRSKENRKGKRFYVVAGPEVAFLLNGKVKQISDQNGKQKFKDDYNFAPFRYGGSLRVGTNGISAFVKYYASDMFDSAPQKGLKSMAFGLTLGIN